MLFWYTFFSLIVFSPILYVYGFGGFEAAKITFFLITGSLMLIAFVKNKKNNNDSIIINRPLTTYSLIALASYITVRSFFCEGLNLAWLGSYLTHLGSFVWLVFVLLIIALINLRGNEKIKKTIILSAFISLVAVLISVALQHFGLMGGEWHIFDDPTRGRTLFGSIGSSTYLGIVITMLTFISLPLIRASNNIFRYLAITVLAIATITVFLTKSITGIAILVLGLALHLLKAPQYINKFIFISLFIIISISPFVLLSPKMQSSLSSVAPSLVDRAYIWQSSIDSLDNSKTILFGAGSEHFQFLYDQHFPQERIDLPSVTEEEPHNIILEILTEWGLVGLLLFLTFSYYLLQESKLNKTATLNLLLLWLLLQFNFLSANLLVISLILIKLAFEIKSQKSIILRTKLLLPLSALIFVLSSVIGLGTIASSVANHFGGVSSAKLDFNKSVSIFEQATKYSIFDKSFTLLQLAEARANRAILNNDYSDYAQTEEILLQALKGNPSARQYAIAIRIIEAYAAHDNNASRELSRTVNLFAKKWGSHPKHQDIIKSFKKVGWL